MCGRGGEEGVTYGSGGRMVVGLEFNGSLRTISVHNDSSPDQSRQNRDKTDEGGKV